ncbi:hypothetical protein AAMO2058_000006700 [Amorphochlora amoebiformis]
MYEYLYTYIYIYIILNIIACNIIPSPSKPVFSSNRGNYHLIFSPSCALKQEEEAQGEEAEDWETTLKSKIIKHKNLQVEEREEKTEGGIKGKEKVDEGGDKVKGTDTRDNANNERESSLVEALADVAHISAPMLFNYLSCRHRRVLILDVRSEDSRKKNGYVPRSVLLKVPESLPESLNVNIIQGMLPGRKEKMAFRSYRIYQTVVIGDSDQPGSIGHSIASTLHMRQIRGGVSQGNVFLLRGGFSEFKMLYPSLSDPDSKLLDEVKGPVKVGVNFLQPLDLPSEIINQYLFLGSHKDAERKSVLLTLGITHILIISKHRGKFNPYPETFEYARLGLAEGQDDGMLRATQFINAAQKNKPDGKKGDRILVAGITGNSAAASVVLAFMMKTGLMTLTEAFHELQNRRYSVCLSRPRWETLSRFEQSLLKKDTLEACIDLERAPPADAEEPVPEPRRDSKQLPPKTKGGSANESSDYHKGTRIRWGVNDYLQEKAERLVALVTALNTRYIGLKRENQQLQAQINSLRNSSMMGKKSPDQLSDTDTPASLRVELETLRTALKEYGSRLIRLGGIDGLAKV